MTTQTAAQSASPSATPDNVVALIPRINIAAFCDDPGTASVMQSVAADRRLSRAHMDVRTGGISGAIQAYSQSQTPQVLIVESTRDRDGMFAELPHLANVCDPATKVIVIGHVNDILLYRDLIAQGISDYIVAPLKPLAVVDVLGSMFADPERGKVGKVISFIGAKGGVGSSTLAHNVGWLLAGQFAQDTVITDLDMAFGTLGLNFNQDPGQGVAEALGASDRVDQVLIDRLLTKCTERLSLMLAPASVERQVKIDADAVETMLDIIRASTPNVIIDIPSGWSAWTKRVLVQSDEIVITATPEIASLRNTKNMIDLLKSARPNDVPPKLVLNQVGVPKRPEIPVADFAKAVELEPCQVIGFDAVAFGTATSNGQMIAEVAGKSKAAEAIDALARALGGQEPEKASSGLSLGSLLEKIKLGKK